jgi:hypothetical protein
VNKIPTLDFSLIQKEWKVLLAAMEFKLEREFPVEASSAKQLIHYTFKVARNSHNTVMYICADKPKDPFRSISYSVSCPPMVRSAG